MIEKVALFLIGLVLNSAGIAIIGFGVYFMMKAIFDR